MPAQRVGRPLGESKLNSVLVVAGGLDGYKPDICMLRLHGSLKSPRSVFASLKNFRKELS